jgi:ribosome-associated protein
MSEIPLDTYEVIKAICQSLYDKKGFNILCLDVRGISSITDFFIIAEGNVSKHLQALAYSISDSLKAFDRRPLRVEGRRDSDWIVMDYGDCIIHLFIPESREKYAIEQVWSDGQIINVPIQLISPYSASLSLRKGTG